MKIHVNHKRCPIRIDKSSVDKLVHEFLAFHKQNIDEVGITFVGIPTMCRMHADFFNDPSPTDCISFPMDDTSEKGYRHLGEVVVCPDVALQYVGEHGGDAAREITLYVVHGLLHLIGFDDIDPEDRKVMRKEEARFLKKAPVLKITYAST